jgi:RNA polymerase sigma-70 factor (ECF subfamily)
LTALSTQASDPTCLGAATDPAAAAEATLVTDSLAGDAGAAREIVHRHHRRVFGFLCQMLSRRQDAEDVAQETFVKAFRNLHRFDTSRPLINWLLTIARRSALNHYRGTRHWDPIPDEIPSPAASPAHEAEQNDQVDDIWSRARERLGEREFHVLWLRFGENLSTSETARVAGLTETHVKVLVHRARQRLLQDRSSLAPAP